MNYYSLSGFTANFETPKHYFDQVIGYIPNTLDRLAYWINQPIVEKFARITLIAWFIFRLLKTD